MTSISCNDAGRQGKADVAISVARHTQANSEPIQTQQEHRSPGALLERAAGLTTRFVTGATGQAQCAPGVAYIDTCMHAQVWRVIGSQFGVNSFRSG